MDHYQATATTAIQKAALQVAIWKAEYETDTTNLTDLNHGRITLTGLDATVAADATAYLTASLDNHGALSSSAGILVHYLGDAQDQLLDPHSLPPSVPEPKASLVMSGTALLAVAGLGLRRRKARTAQA